MRVFVTGSAGCLAHALLPKLCADPDISEVTGVDAKPTHFTHPRFNAQMSDIRRLDLAQILGGHDAVVHLAFAIRQGKLTSEEMASNNVGGTMNVFAAARQARITKVINLSSVAVYGPGENLTETARLRPSEKFAYAGQKATIERRAAIDYPEVVHLRAHFIFGPNAHRFLHRLCNARAYVSLQRPGRLQVVHEEDVAQAIVNALKLPVTGAFNLAAPEVVTLEEFVRNGRRLMIPVPIQAVRWLAAIARKYGATADFTWTDVIDATLTVNCDRAKAELGWTPRFTAPHTRAAMTRNTRPAFQA